MRRCSPRVESASRPAAWYRSPVSWALVSLSGLLLLAGTPSAGSAQTNPGEGWRPSGDALKAEYYADVIKRVSSMIAEVRTAWEEDDIDELLDHYTDDAAIVFPGEDPIKGRLSLRDYLARLLPNTGTVTLSMTDFDASGGMAFISGHATFEVDNPAGPRRRVQGHHVTVMMREGKTWRIRHQEFDETSDEPLPIPAIAEQRDRR